MPVPPVIQMYRYVMGSGGGLGNLLKASEEFQQTVDWVRYPTNSETPTVNADSRPDPNGGTTADQVDYTANTGARLMQTVTLKASTEYTFSVHARAVSGTVDFRMRNITLKAAVQKTATTTGPLTNGFTRFTYTFTTGAAGSYELALQNASGTPTARSVIFWGAMLNEGGTAADYEYAAPSTGGSAPAPAYAGFGDSFGGVTAYYSLRQFTEAETLNAIRVRRSSDDTEQDIGFDANGDLDTTALTTFVNADVNQYTSDFSSTEDLGESNGTGAAAQSVGGVDDAYKLTCDSTISFHSATTPSIFEVGQVYNVSFKYYIPSGQTIDGIRFIDWGISNQSTLDEWVSVNETNLTSTRSNIRFFAADGTSITPSTNVDGDVFYLKDLIITQTTADGAVTTFYDQSGNGNNATNATASEQPLVVSGGTLVTENGKAAVEFDGDDLLQKTSASVDIAEGASLFTILSDYTSGAAFSANSGGSQTNDEFLLWSSSSTQKFRYGRTPSGGVSVSQISTQQIFTGIDDGSTSLSVFQNGTTTNSGTSTTVVSAVNLITIGARGAASLIYEGKIQELILFDSDQSTNRGSVSLGTGIEGNINTYFDIV